MRDDHVDIHPVRDGEHARAGEVTVNAYREFATPHSPTWDAYLLRIGDVAGRSEHATVLVATTGGVVAGSATLEIDRRMNPASTEPLAPDEAHLRMLGVDPGLQGRGIGRSLVLACIELARGRGKRRLTLGTGPAMTAAQQLYTALGFTFEGERDTPDGVHLLRYTLDIGADPQATR
ncbi:MAG: GNAT family N-acetyltransferase [Candidatus Dormiibacterota bacterium]